MEDESIASGIPDKLRQLIDGYLEHARVVQLATSTNDSPWICSVYFVHDSQLRIYWLSYPSRRHSLDIAINQKVALTIAVKQEMPVIGIQAEGVAKRVSSMILAAKIMPAYISKYGTGGNFLANLKNHKNKHALYCFTPSRMVVFDEKTFGHDNEQEIVFGSD